MYASEEKKRMSGVMTRTSYCAFAVLPAADCRRRARASRKFARKDIVSDEPLGEFQVDLRTHAYNSVIYEPEE